MSKYNKVNPGQYSQAGRLTPDETARELTHQRTAAGGDRPKVSGATGTPKTQRAPRARGSAARGSSPQRGGKPGAHKGTTKGKGL